MVFTKVTNILGKTKCLSHIPLILLVFGLYLFAEHRRHQILPGLVRDGDIGFQGIILLVTGEGHTSNQVRWSFIMYQAVRKTLRVER